MIYHKKDIQTSTEYFMIQKRYKSRFVYCRELAPGTIGLTGDWVRGDDN